MDGADSIQLGAPHAPIAHIGMKKDSGGTVAYDLCRKPGATGRYELH
jgi:hypothetical protein